MAMVAELWAEIMDSEPSRTTLLAPDDYMELYGNPFALVSTAGPRPEKGKGKMISREAMPPPTARPDEGVDWTARDPPDALGLAPSVDSELLLRVIASSIDRVNARVAKEVDVKRQQSAARRQREDDASEAQRQTNSEDPEPYLPIITPGQCTGPPDAETERDAYVPNRVFLSENGEGSSTGAGLIVFPRIKPKKGSRFKITRFLRKQLDKSAAAKATLLSSPKSTGFTTHLCPNQSNEQERRPRLDTSLQVECVSCLDDFSPAETVKTPCHHYCRECFRRLINAACQNEQQWPPKCCLNVIPTPTILSHISANLRSVFDARLNEWSVPAADRLYCARPECGLFVAPSRVDRAARIARCAARHRTCTICREQAHPDADECPRDQDVELIEALAEEEGWLRCGRCRAVVEHREACQHMTCRCGYEFCYVCSAVWMTCTCDMVDLAHKKEAAEARRVARREREAREEAELQEALRQVADFERDEALKAELLRQEMERQEEKRLQVELEERIRLESIRRSEVETRFARLRDILAELHVLQRVWVAQHQFRLLDILEQESTSSTEALRKKHEAQKAALDARVVEKLAAKESALMKDYAARVAEESVVEEAYLAQLDAFYCGCKGADERIAQEMKRLRRRMDNGWRDWQRWRQGEMAAYRARLEEERAIRDELMFSAERRHEDSLAEREKELETGREADAQWFNEVVAERERMLVEMEEEELDNGDDAASLLASSDDAAGGEEGFEKRLGNAP